MENISKKQEYVLRLSFEQKNRENHLSFKQIVFKD